MYANRVIENIEASRVQVLGTLSGSVRYPTGLFIGVIQMYIHGGTKTRLHNIWLHMRTRCRTVNSKDYINYGGRGIALCAEWDEYVNFRDWALSNGYNEKLTIDRIDNNGNYCPENCRWTTMQAQNNNRRNNRLFEISGQKKTLRQWCNKFLADYETTRARIKSGWTLIDALKTPKQKPWARKRLGLI